MDYGNVVYEAAVIFKPFILKPVHKDGICFATGMFCYSLLESLNVKPEKHHSPCGGILFFAVMCQIY
jgi:hypothetical protein